MNGELDAAGCTELVMKLRQGDNSAYQMMMDQWEKRVFNYALRYANDHHFAMEVVQQTFIQAFEKIDQLKDPAKLKSWIYRIASNNCSSEGRKISRRKYTEVNEQALSKVDSSNPARTYERKELKVLVLETLQEIPAEQRQVIIMKEYENLKFREIADILGESENTIKSRMYYGLNAMRKILNNKNLTKEIYYE